MYDIRLANVCQFLQSNDHNGEFDILFKEVLNGETDKSIAYEVCRNAITETMDNHLSPNDKEGRKEWQSWLDYLNQ